MPGCAIQWDAGNANLVTTPAITVAHDVVPEICIFVSELGNNL